VPLAPPWGGSDYGPAIDFIRRAHERGIKSDLVVELQYRQGSQRRPVVTDMPNMWPSYPLSNADPARFRLVFEPLFNELESLGITFAALELGNEINWAGFNGEFPIPGEGRVFGREDLEQDPEACQVAGGYRAYLRTLTVLKDIRDHSRFNRETPILSAGLADPGSAGSRPTMKADAVTIPATLEYLRASGVDSLVDAYAVHTYPWADTTARRRASSKQTLSRRRVPTPRQALLADRMGLPALAPVSRQRYLGPRECVHSGDFRQFVSQGRLTGLSIFPGTMANTEFIDATLLDRSGRLVFGFAHTVGRMPTGVEERLRGPPCGLAAIETLCPYYDAAEQGIERQWKELVWPFLMDEHEGG
jgi:hypothetical protein